MTGSSEPFVAMRPDPGAKRLLLCIPQSGAGVAAFRKWPPGLRGAANVYGARLPGRERRLHEEPLTSIGAMADELAGAVADVVATAGAQAICLFGHCSGALVALEVAYRLSAPEAAAARLEHLIVSGQGLPSANADGLDANSISSARSALSRLGGTPAEVLADDDLMELVRPALEADLAAAAAYRPNPGRAPLAVPVTAIGGASDALVQAGDLDQWQAVTTARFRLRTFDAGHFFLTEREPEVLEYLRDLIGGEP